MRLTQVVPLPELTQLTPKLDASQLSVYLVLFFFISRGLYGNPEPCTQEANAQPLSPTPRLIFISCHSNPSNNCLLPKPRPVQATAGLQQALASGQHHSTAGRGHGRAPRQIHSFILSRQGLGGSARHVGILQPPSMLEFFPPAQLSSQVFGATYQHWGRGH